jgi:hypothetical protein
MTTAFVLIAIINAYTSSSQTSSITHEFSSRETCVSAGQAIEDEYVKRRKFYAVIWICSPK